MPTPVHAQTPNHTQRCGAAGGGLADEGGGAQHAVGHAELSQRLAHAGGAGVHAIVSEELALGESEHGACFRPIPPKPGLARRRADDGGVGCPAASVKARPQPRDRSSQSALAWRLPGALAWRLPPAPTPRLASPAPSSCWTSWRPGWMQKAWTCCRGARASEEIWSGRAGSRWPRPSAAGGRPNSGSEPVQGPLPPPELCGPGPCMLVEYTMVVQGIRERGGEIQKTYRGHQGWRQARCTTIGQARAGGLAGSRAPMSGSARQQRRGPGLDRPRKTASTGAVVGRMLLLWHRGRTGYSRMGGPGRAASG